MLTLATVRPGRERYYFSTVADGREPRPGLVEPDPYFLGTGARALALEGVPDLQQVRALFRRLDPASLEPLGPRAGRPAEIAAFDLVFSAPKGVSLVQALAEEPLSGRVRDSHEAAVASVMSFVEEELLRVRRRQDGRDLHLGTDGAIAVAFPHRASRANDPHLHTHVLLLNLARSEGTFGAIDGRELFGAQRLLRSLYDSELRARLTRQGMAFTELRRGYSDLAVIPRATVREFSRQSALVRAALAAAGPLRPGERDELTRIVRPPKDTSRSYEQLVAEWRVRSYEVGLSRRRLGSIVGAELDPPAKPPPKAWLKVASRDPTGTVSRLELCYGRAASDAGGCLVREAVADADDFLARSGLGRSGERYVVSELAERFRESGERLAEKAGTLELGRLTYVAGGRLDALDQLAALSSGREVVALTPGRRASETFLAATGISSSPIGQASKDRHRADWVVLPDCWALSEGELDSAIERAENAGAGLLFFGSAARLDSSLLLTGLLGRAATLERRAIEAELPLTDLSLSGSVVEAVGSPSAACRRAADLAHWMTREGTAALVSVPEACMKGAVVAELERHGAEGRVRVALSGRAVLRRDEAHVSLGDLASARRRDGLPVRTVLVVAGRVREEPGRPGIRLTQAPSRGRDGAIGRSPASGIWR